MSLFKIAWRSIQQRALSSALTALSMALGVALVIAVLVAYGVVRRSFDRGAEGFDLIVGAKGGKLQLVLNTIYHLSTPVENVPWNYYKEFRPGGRFEKQIRVAIPFCLGDNYQGYRVVGTIPELFEVEYAQGSSYKFRDGRNFRPDYFFEAVIGYLAAQRTGLKVGDSFFPTHGVSEGKLHDEDAFKVVGILEPTGTPNDRAVFVNMEGFYLLDGHAKPLSREQQAASTPSEKSAPAIGEKHNYGHLPLPDNQREVTAILVRTANPLVNVSLPRLINKEPYAQAVFPVSEISSLFNGIVGNIEKVLLFLAGLVVVVSGIGIMVSIYNSMSERRREIAIMRALGASRRAVLSIVLLESILLSLGGGLLGLFIGHGLIGVLSPIIVAQTGVTMSMFQFEYFEWVIPLERFSSSWQSIKVPVYWELVLIPGLIALASLVGFLPALAAYRTDVSKSLSAM